MTNEQRLRRNAYMREWKRRNKEKVNAVNRAVKDKDPELYKAINKKSRDKQFAKDPERIRDYSRRAREKDPIGYLLMHARRRAKTKGVHFGLRRGDFVLPIYCPVLGMKLVWGKGQRASANKASPSLDRMNPAEGYISGNVRVISNRANNLKNNATVEEVRAVLEYMEGKR